MTDYTDVAAVTAYLAGRLDITHWTSATDAELQWGHGFSRVGSPCNVCSEGGHTADLPKAI